MKRAPVEACPVLLELGGGVTWWLADPIWQDAARQASREIAAPGAICPTRRLKAAVRRLVFSSPPSATTAWVVKAFPLEGLRSRLKHRKYALSEARNLWRARQRSVPAPALYGWGEARRRGTVRWNAVMMQRVGGRTFTEALAAAPDQAAREDVLERCATLFRALYLAGCNHIDLKPEAVRLGSTGAEDVVIDFQYCTFSAAPSLTTVMAQAGHFAHWWEKEQDLEPVWVDRWIAVLLDVLEVSDADRPAALATAAATRRRVPSIAERLRQ